jgi:hypothetical protein
METLGKSSQTEKDLEITVIALEILEKEKNRLEATMIKHLSYNERKFYGFSKVLELAVPGAFNCCYAENNDGDQIRFNAFLPERIHMAEIYASDPDYAPLFSEFMMNYAPVIMLHSHGRRACTHAELNQINMHQCVARSAAMKATLKG